MSALLADIITQRRQKALEYEQYLEKINALIHQVNRGSSDDTPSNCDTPGKRALYNTLGDDKLALEVHESVIRKRDADWRGNLSRERIVKGAIYSVVQDKDRTEMLFQIIKAQQEY